MQCPWAGRPSWTCTAGRPCACGRSRSSGCCCGSPCPCSPACTAQPSSLPSSTTSLLWSAAQSSLYLTSLTFWPHSLPNPCPNPASACLLAFPLIPASPLCLTPSSPRPECQILILQQCSLWGLCLHHHNLHDLFAACATHSSQCSHASEDGLASGCPSLGSWHSCASHCSTWCTNSRQKMHDMRHPGRPFH